MVLNSRFPMCLTEDLAHLIVLNAGWFRGIIEIAHTKQFATIYDVVRMQ